MSNCTKTTCCCKCADRNERVTLMQNKLYMMYSNKHPTGTVRQYSKTLGNGDYLDTDGFCWPECRPVPIDQRFEYGD